MQSFMALTQMLVLPLYFLSGAMFPASNLPTWLTVINRIDPLTYAVDPIRREVFEHLNVSAAVREKLDPGVTWGGWHVPTLLEVAVVAALGLIMLCVAIAEFSKTE
jgi:ABC-2 type transport system permease protein